MVIIKERNQNFLEDVQNKSRIIVLYGAGKAAKKKYPILCNMFEISYVCESFLTERKVLGQHEVISLKDLECLNVPVTILLCIEKESIRKEVKDTLLDANIDADVYDYFDNVAFDVYRFKNEEKVAKPLKNVNLILYDEGWIISKFAHKLKNCLEKKGIRAIISDSENPYADINHHLIYGGFDSPVCYNDTLMITHVDTVSKIEMLKHHLRIAKMGICMSKDTMDMLTKNGIPREKLCYVNPAQDGVIAPKKYILGMTYRGYDDNRKKLSAILDICEHISPLFFEFKIMGTGWDSVVKKMKDMGFAVTYYPDFDYDEYVKLMSTLDYYLYWGFDEGQMGVLDALRAGVGTIITPQGYHLDLKNGITYSCSTKQDFIDTLQMLENERRKRVESVSTWTWDAYAEKHIDIWNYILGNTEHLYDHQHEYEDGFNSILPLDR